MVKFINFGCWNEGASRADAPLKTVIRQSMDHNPDFYIINGDNYYQPKDGEVKMVSHEEINEGLKYLSDTNKEVFLLMGNHDLEITGLSHTCETIIAEKAYSNFNLPTDLVMFKEIDNTIIIMIDTNMYVDEDLLCYNEILTQPLETNIEVFQSHQTKRIADRLSGKTYDNIIVCGHHPLIGFKNQKMKKDKKGKTKLKGGLEHIGTECFDLLFDTIRPHSNQFYYFCADIHNYQNGTVRITKHGESMIINQYIVGTGGTELDEDYNGRYNPNFETEGASKDIINYVTHIPKGSNYRIDYDLSEHWYDFGNVVVDIVDNNISVVPIKLGIMSSVGGKKRKSRRTREKKSRGRGKTHKYRIRRR